jgi:hypothetical protein
LAGEQGPELFTPGSSGSITPNARLSRFGQTNVFNIDAREADAGMDFENSTRSFAGNGFIGRKNRGHASGFEQAR